ncbi:MAG: hypothetical protein M3417_11470 [Actinomycetota bacterium]|nr:hypothetical protein [Actinomycetota bacterium]
MPSSPDHQHHVRRVVLPSGKTIEVVYFEDLAVRDPAAAAEPGSAELHVCGACASELAYPVAWEEAGEEAWEVTVRCPNCEWRSTGIYAQETVERFDDQLDCGTEAVVRDLKRLMHANMENEIERFVKALEAELILPEDF